MKLRDLVLELEGEDGSSSPRLISSYGPICLDLRGQLDGHVAAGLLDPPVALEAEAQERVVLGHDLRARAREVQGEGAHVAAQVVDVEDQVFGQDLLVAPDHPADAGVDQAVLVARGADAGHPRQAEVPGQVGLQERGDHRARGPVDVDRDVDPGPGLDEHKPSSIDKWLDAAPLFAPVISQIVGGFFQTIHFGLTTWQTVAYNNALAKNGEPKPPTTMEKTAEPGKPLAPQGPAPTAEQQAQQTQWNTIMSGIQTLAPHLIRFLDKGKSGAELAEFVIENADEQRTSYERIKHLADSLVMIGVQVPRRFRSREVHECRAILL